MKLSELLGEAPDFINRELPVTDTDIHVSFYSMDTIQREFLCLSKSQFDGKTVWTIIKKDHSFAVIGELGKRSSDNKPGLFLIGHLDFKPEVDWEYWPKEAYVVDQRILQVDGVQLMNAAKFKGLATLFYESIVDAGDVLVSDTTQYIGGRKLWEKLATSSKHKVLLVKNGHLILDDTKPLIYNGSNFPSEQIWREPSGINDSAKHFLLVLTKR